MSAGVMGALAGRMIAASLLLLVGAGAGNGIANVNNALDSAAAARPEVVTEERVIYRTEEKIVNVYGVTPECEAAITAAGTLSEKVGNLSSVEGGLLPILNDAKVAIANNDTPALSYAEQDVRAAGRDLFSAFRATGTYQARADQLMESYKNSY